ncbi:sugar phosphate isomerase/epimerase family protein [Sporofaciens musculi]|uniref:sugar phosphate isomerase/epimerase family protein n=1 Tax=Sporofaciens musculi TaxID=2681861 RepID=UPI002ED2E3F0
MGIKLSISNIAWDAVNDQVVYDHMRLAGYMGLEIAPTRMFPGHPYEKKTEAQEYVKKLQEEYGLKICSLQSIWYGRREKIFGAIEEREALLEYTKKAVDFAEVVGTENLVFGCPKNRCIGISDDRKVAVRFFKELGDYAAEHSTVLAMEANPVIYETNFINTTKEAIELIQEVGSIGFKLNLDFGTICYNRENLEELAPYIDIINHVHISEPALKLIGKREEHRKLMGLLRDAAYDGYVSIEMGRQENIMDVLNTIDYVATL